MEFPKPRVGSFFKVVGSDLWVTSGEVLEIVGNDLCVSIKALNDRDIYYYQHRNVRYIYDRVICEKHFVK